MARAQCSQPLRPTDSLPGRFGHEIANDRWSFPSDVAQSVGRPRGVLTRDKSEIATDRFDAVEARRIVDVSDNGLRGPHAYAVLLHPGMKPSDPIQQLVGSLDHPGQRLDLFAQDVPL